MLQNRDIENSGPCNSSLDENTKKDFNLENNRLDFETIFSSEYYDNSKMLPKDNINSKILKKCY